MGKTEAQAPTGGGPGARARVELAEWLGLESSTLRELPQHSIEVLLGLIETVHEVLPGTVGE
ncbi:MAG TPA: hypothetical protein VIN56_04785, partial [Candidatus Dormibacteraeota bacterium]